MNKIRYTIDAACQDFVEGWALGPSGPCDVEVTVNGRPVGRAVTGLSRHDVGAALPDVPGSDSAGFLYVFNRDEVSPTGQRDISVSLRIRGGGLILDTEQLTIPVLDPSVRVALLETRGDRELPRSPFPPTVLELLVRASPALAGQDLTSDAGALAAIDVLEYLLPRGPRPMPGVHRYLGYLRAVHGAALFAAQYFPRANTRSTGHKDRTAMLTGPPELTAIAHHLFVLADAGIPGVLLEFGCYKGYSTSILSTACHLLGRQMDVFDSFEGLPASNSTYYRPGEFAGGQVEVERNVAEFGRPGVVTYHPGFFSESLPRWTPRPAACLWMDVDLEQSAIDALKVFTVLDARGALFSHECQPASFNKRRPVPDRGPENVVGPIVDAFASAGRQPVGLFIHGCTGAFWDAQHGIPVLPPAAFDRVLSLALT
jgi:hypothetical protein